MGTTTIRLLACHISHDYFPDGRWPFLKVRPCPDTRSMFQRRRLKLRTTPSGFELIYLFDGQKAPTSPIQARLLLFPEQPAFEVFTELPFREQGFTHYFCDFRPTLAPQPLPRKEVLQAEKYPFRSNTFVWKQSLPDGTLLQIKDDCGREVGAQLALNNQRAYVDLTSNPHGRYAICTDDLPPQWFVTGDAWGASPMAILDLHLDLSPAGLASGSENDGFQAPLREMALEFKARSVYWRYLLQIPRKSPGAKQLEIVEAQDRIRFKKEEAGQDERGNSTLQLHSFLSTTPIPFQKRFPFELSVQRNDTKEVLFKKIPFPESKRLEKGPGEGDEKSFIAQKWLVLH